MDFFFGSMDPHSEEQVEVAGIAFHAAIRAHEKKRNECHFHPSPELGPVNVSALAPWAIPFKG
jgi:hypothetical protein